MTSTDFVDQRIMASDLSVALTESDREAAQVVGRAIDCHDLTTLVSTVIEIGIAVDCEEAGAARRWGVRIAPGVLDRAEHAAQGMPGPDDDVSAWAMWVDTHVGYLLAAELLALVDSGKATFGELVAIGDRVEEVIEAADAAGWEC